MSSASNQLCLSLLDLPEELQILIFNEYYGIYHIEIKQTGIEDTVHGSWPFIQQTAVIKILGLPDLSLELTNRLVRGVAEVSRLNAYNGTLYTHPRPLELGVSDGPRNCFNVINAFAIQRKYQWLRDRTKYLKFLNASTMWMAVVLFPFSQPHTGFTNFRHLRNITFQIKNNKRVSIRQADGISSLARADITQQGYVEAYNKGEKDMDYVRTYFGVQLRELAGLMKAYHQGNICAVHLELFTTWSVGDRSVQLEHLFEFFPDRWECLSRTKLEPFWKEST